MRLSAIVIGALGAALASCDSSAPGASVCASNEECAAGAVCDGGACVKLCVSDVQCEDGKICNGNACISGARSTPQITSVDGDSSVVCPDAGGTNCIVSGLVVNGTSLAGAAFSLAPQGGGGAIQLAVRAGASDTTATVDFPDVLQVQTGSYTLSAVNQSGRADQAVSLIQGPAGPSGPAGAPPTGDQLVGSINGASLQIAFSQLQGVASASHQHPASDVTSGTLDIARLPVGTSASTVAQGDHTHGAAAIVSGTLDRARLPVGTGACYTHWGATSCAAGFDTVMAGRVGGLESYTAPDTGGSNYSNVECVSAAATATEAWGIGGGSGGNYYHRFMRGDADMDGMQQIDGTCSICCTGGCYVALGTSTCAAGYTQTYAGRAGSIEGYTGGKPNGATLCLDGGATAAATWASGYSTRIMRSRAARTDGSFNGMESISNACAVCCK